nr:hypothetical protein [uncultured Arsenicibacter sp.]
MTRIIRQLLLERAKWRQFVTYAAAGSLVTGLFFSSPDAYAQQADTVRRTTQGDRCTPRENLFKLGIRPYSDTLKRADFKAQYGSTAELTDCDTTLQTFVLVRRPSPWKVGLFAGPNFAYCGTWDNTFGPNKRDKSLYNGTGFNITGNADYYFSRPERRLKFGLGAALGYQNYITRSAYRNSLVDLGVSRGIPANQISVIHRSSEDMYLTIGPALQWIFARSRRNPTCTSFLELAVRGGLFRTQAATIAAFAPAQNDRLIRSVNPSDKLYHPGGLMSLGVFFPLRNNWHLGVQAQGFYTKLNYLIVDNGGDMAGQLMEFERKHGGFSAGLAVRKGFNQKRLIPKAPTSCPTCDSIPTVAVRFNNMRINGQTVAYRDSLTETLTAPVVSWKSTTLNARNETFTARLYYRPDTVVTSTGDQVIAQKINTTDTTLALPTEFLSNGQPRRGFYYVTVHNRQDAKCGSCMSEVATTSFAFLNPAQPVLASAPCKYTHKLERLEVNYRTPYTREVANVCYCNGTVTSVGDTVTRLRYRSLNRRLAGEYSFENEQLVLNLKDLPGDLAQLLQTEKSRIESGSVTRYKGRRVRPQVQNFRAVFTVTQPPCNGQPESVIGSFSVVISDNTYSITSLRPLSDAEYQKLITPAPAPARRSRSRR